MERWLSSSGYQYHCFISWAHSPNPELLEWASNLKNGIEGELAYYINHPRVFLDENEITGGADWERSLRTALCHSVSLVAICAPIYFNPEHKWCGLEWAAMDQLGKRRLPDEDFCTNIPVIIRASKPLPTPVSRVQPIDLSRLATKSRNYARTTEFRSCILEIADRILKIAQAIKRRQATPNCGEFQIPLAVCVCTGPTPTATVPLPESVMAVNSPELGTIITFYSYKGGVGRTMALANVACLLAKRCAPGGRILTMDWDLEAPGLHRFFAQAERQENAARPGVINYFHALFQVLQERAELPVQLSVKDGLEGLG